MWDRKELKAKGKAAFRANYWRSVVAALVLMIAVSAFAAGNGNAARDSADQAAAQAQLEADLNALPPEEAAQFVGLLGAILAGIIVIALVLMIVDIFVLNPLEVGGQRFFLSNSEKPAQTSELGFSFSNGYMNIVKTIFLRDLFLVLWGMLFVIPGIVKMYSYRLVPFILAENPNMGAKEAITLSREMMNGQKMNAFILDLSFIGWYLLACVTCGLSGIFYSNPYQFAANAELYKAIKNGQTVGAA